MIPNFLHFEYKFLYKPLKSFQQSLPSRWRAVVAMNGDKVKKMGDVARRNLGPIPEELNLSDPNQEDSDLESDLESDLSMVVQNEIETLSQELDDLTGRVNNPS